MQNKHYFFNAQTLNLICYTEESVACKAYRKCLKFVQIVDSSCQKSRTFTFYLCKHCRLRFFNRLHEIKCVLRVMHFKWIVTLCFTFLYVIYSLQISLFIFKTVYRSKTVFSVQLLYYILSTSINRCAKSYSVKTVARVEFRLPAYLKSNMLNADRAIFLNNSQLIRAPYRAERVTLNCLLYSLHRKTLQHIKIPFSNHQIWVVVSLLTQQTIQWRHIKYVVPGPLINMSYLLPPSH